VVTFTLTPGTSTTASSITRVSVDWGDGQTQSYTGLPPTISHSYRNAASYLIVVTGVDALGDTSTSTGAVTVLPKPQLVVTISSSTANPNAGSTTSFTIGATPTSGNAITSVVVDFGDGTSQTFQGNTTSVQHVYQAAGTYTVTAVATDSSGATGSASMGLVVGSSTTASFTVTPSSPTTHPAAESFDASGSSSSSPITSYQWNFGDPGSGSNTASGVTTTHTYASAGTYTITLTITDSSGHTASTTRQLVVP
jgi:PKD repeat protein